MRRRIVALAGGLLAVLLAVYLLHHQGGGGTVGRISAPPRPSSTLAFEAGDFDPGTGVGLAPIVGRVVDPDGRGISGAVVTLVVDEETSRDSRQRRPGRLATADAQGAFVLADVRPGAYVLSAAAGGFLPKTERVQHPGKVAQRSIIVTLRRGGFVISGRVLDGLGTPIFGAVVSRIASGWRDDEGGLATSVADEKGAYRLTVPGGEHRLIFRRDGYAERAVSVRATRDQTIDVRLSSGVRLEGRVVARDTQEGIASALVTVRSVRSLEDLAQGVTDPEGGFSIGGLPAGTYEVVARKGTLAGSYERPLVLAPPGEQRIVLAIDQGATIEGRVRTARGASVGSARLALGRWDFETRRGDPAGAADASGRFTIRGVLPEHTAVIALVGEQVSGSRRIHVQPGDHISGVEIVVPETGELLALVLAEGQPASAEVSVWSARGGAGWQAMARTGSDGQARFATIPAGKVVVEATDAEGRRAETLTEVGDGSRSLARLVLEPVEKVTVQGGVSWMDGRPATGITVFIYCRGLEWEHQRSDDRGAYRFEGCEAGPFDVRAFRSDAGLDDWQRAHSPGNHPPLAPGERIRTVNLTVPSGGKRVAGQVFTPEGQPASAAQVTVGGGLEERSDSTDEGGRFEFLDLARQRHSVRVRAAGHPEAHVVTTEADATALVFRLRPGARLSGTVRGPEGKPRPYARVIASSAAGGGETYSSGNGTFILIGLGAGAHEVSVRGDDGRDHPVANVILEAGADKHLDLTVKDGVDLRN